MTALAAILEQLADWAEDAVAGGAPERWVAAQLIEACRFIATTIRSGGLS